MSHVKITKGYADCFIAGSVEGTMSFITKSIKGAVIGQLRPFLAAYVKAESLDADTITLDRGSLRLQGVVRSSGIVDVPRADTLGTCRP